LAAVKNLQSTIEDVHRDFKAKTHVGSSWFFPFHTVTPSVHSRKTRLTHWQRICQHGLQYWCWGGFAGSANYGFAPHDFHEFQVFRPGAALCAAGIRTGSAIAASMLPMNPLAVPAYPLPAPPTSGPYATGLLDAGDGHQIYFEQCGQPLGLPVVFLHGGPGSGCSARHRQMFDAQRNRVVLFDQRGCGRSLPRGSVQNNTSAHLVADIERLRTHLGIDRWLVVGGSWGAGLALAYAAAHRASCLGLVLRGVFLGRASDIDWFFQQSGQLLPDAWEALANQAPAALQGNLLQWLATRVNSGEPQVAQQAAQAWAAWEQALSERGVPAADGAPIGAQQLDGDAAQAQVDKYRVQCHYLTNACFWGDVGLLERTASLAQLPTAILHGRLDWICRGSAAWELHRRLAGSRLQWLDDCGHSPFEPAMARAMTGVLSHFSTHQRFAGWGQDFFKG
jgi:proline iminopeptidase